MEALLNALSRIDAWRRRPAVRRGAYALAAIGFVGGLVASIHARPSLVQGLDLRFALAAFAIYSPAIMMLNAFAMRAAAAAAGADIAIGPAARLAILANAANQLPLPGGAAVRVSAYCDAGATFASATRMTFVYGVIWLAMGLIVAAICAARLDAYSLALSLAVASAALLVVGARLASRQSSTRTEVVKSIVYGLISAISYVGGLWLAVGALGGATPIDALGVVAVAGVIGSAASIAPGGLGVREASAAAIAILVGMDPALAFSATALLHLITAAAYGVAAVAIASAHGSANPASEAL
ncbi:MAG: hypothetical protein GC152_00320 [Alphaproteobacteria bacterium]|nr:hypothetical protein [Alphaproteobacteria bacterium]